jgi:hypothetical protein
MEGVQVRLVLLRKAPNSNWNESMAKSSQRRKWRDDAQCHEPIQPEN